MRFVILRQKILVTNYAIYMEDSSLITQNDIFFNGSHDEPFILALKKPIYSKILIKILSF